MTEPKAFDFEQGDRGIVTIGRRPAVIASPSRLVFAKGPDGINRPMNIPEVQSRAEGPLSVRLTIMQEGRASTAYMTPEEAHELSLALLHFEGECLEEKRDE